MFIFLHNILYTTNIHTTINQFEHHSKPDDVLRRVVLQLVYIGVHVLKGRCYLYYHCGCQKKWIILPWIIKECTLVYRLFYYLDE